MTFNSRDAATESVKSTGNEKNFDDRAAHIGQLFCNEINHASSIYITADTSNVAQSKTKELVASKLLPECVIGVERGSGIEHEQGSPEKSKENPIAGAEEHCGSGDEKHHESNEEKQAPGESGKEREHHAEHDSKSHNEHHSDKPQGHHYRHHEAPNIVLD